ncbi:MAG: TonB-dependent receptor domain-containing protein [Bacteroidales bacterium]
MSLKHYFQYFSIFIFTAFFTLNLTGQTGIQNLEFKVFGNCGMCEERIEKAAMQVPGVKDAQWIQEEQLLQVKYDPSGFNQQNLVQAISEAGHDSEYLLTSNEIYKNLHACCKYRNNDDYKEYINEHGSLPVIGEPENHMGQEHHFHEEEKSHDDAHVHTHETNDKSMKRHKNGDVHDHAGEILEGRVKAYDEKQNMINLPGVNVYWAGTQVGTITNEKGIYKIPVIKESHKLVISYVGYGSDTIKADNPHDFEKEYIFDQTLSLEEVEIVWRQKSTEISFLDPLKTYNLTEKELQKAACCNLSESFETNPSVDVSFTDAVTGTRQIEMLGLAGPYVQITRANMPNIRGLSSIYGFTYIPGPWMEGIQLNMGTGSVVNGFESVTGQINVELKKPENTEKVYLNLFANEGSRLEANANFTHQFNPSFAGGLFLHVKNQNAEMDRNNDSFLDHPLGEQYILMNRYKFLSKKGIKGQFGVKATIINNESGQADFNGETNNGNATLWKANIYQRRYESWLKTGMIFPNHPSASLGFQMSAVYHDQKSVFGNRVYNGIQKSLYANLIYQRLFGNNHEVKSGMSFQYDDYNELVFDRTYLREEAVPGVFSEYTYNVPEKITAVAGFRGDYHNNYGLFFTPRFHFRYVPFGETVLRASAGRGLRTPSVFAENIGVFASSREFVVHGDISSDKPYGLEPETAWNFGANITQPVHVFNQRELVLGIDFYHTRFDNQVVVDFDENPRQFHIYNLDGESYSNSLQAQADMEVFRGFDLRLAYRFNDVQTDYLSGKKEKPLTSRHRGFLNMAYTTASNWKFDFTVNYQGKKRIPETILNPVEYQMDTYSPGYFLSNAQISKSWNKGLFDIYSGVENMFNYKQQNPILASGDPFGDYFDSSMIWGPVFGRKIYVGLRYKINR